MGEALIAILILASASAYALGAHRLALRRGGRRGASPHDGWWFGAGLAVLAAALFGPLDEWSERSFTLHMTQHEVIMLVAAPLLVRGRPLPRWAWAMGRRARAHLRASLS